MSQPSPATKTTPRPNHQKAMSSRLLTMKFMQRAAAASPASPSTPGTPDLPSNKRQRTDDSPLSFNVNELADQKAVRDALEAEEKRTQAALDKAARDAGDTRWVLNFEEKVKLQEKGVMKVQQMSFANIDRTPAVIRSMDEDGDKPIGGGRRSFGKFNRKLEKLQDPDASSSEESSDEEGEEKNDFDSDSEDDDDPTNQLIKTERDAAARKMKEERKAKRRAEKKEAARLAASRKKNEVNLNSLSSISGGGQAGGPGGGGNSGPCFGCGKEGHQARDCPNKKRSRGGDDHYASQRDQNRNKKARKS